MRSGPGPGWGGSALHTLYISPLKALAVDIHRNLEAPIAEMRLPIRHETRTGDTPQDRRERQRKHPPHLLMTTPESLALMLSYADAGRMSADCAGVVVDELHAMAGTKRGDLLSLGLARLKTLAPNCRIVGLSATVAHPDALTAWLSRTAGPMAAMSAGSHGPPGLQPHIDILETRERLPWSGHMAVHAIAEVYQRIREAGTTVVFVNTRAQAELVFQELWRLNEDTLPIAMHHGSLAREQRRKVEAAMARGALRAVVATSSLDLGIDWAEVDLVVQVGAPKGVSRLLQRIGRSNHRLDQPSRALLVPANRFEVLECRAAMDGVREMTLDGDLPAPGGLDRVGAAPDRHVCSAGFDGDAMYREVTSAAPYAGLPRKDFDDVLNFVATGGYALGSYDRYRRLKRDKEGNWRIASPRFRPAIPHECRHHRRGGHVEGEGAAGPDPGRGGGVFREQPGAGDTFMFAAQLLRFHEHPREYHPVQSRRHGRAEVPAYGGGRMPLSTHLADRVRAMLEKPDAWGPLPEAVQEWLRLQALPLGHAQARQFAGGNVSTRRQVLHGRLHLRGPQRAPDARHAADPAGWSAPGWARSASSRPTT